jgi:mRNA interferase RelE/StbE
MRVIISPKAKRQVKKLSTVNRIVIVKKIRLLSDSIDYKSQNLKKLKGYENIYRLRVGTMRIIFKNNKDEIYIVSVGHRKDIYKSF